LVEIFCKAAQIACTVFSAMLSSGYTRISAHTCDSSVEKSQPDAGLKCAFATRVNYARRV